MHKISSKWKNWTEQIPEFVFSKPGFPEVPPPLPYQIQFYYRAAFKEIRSFLHDRYILLCPLADKFQIEENHLLNHPRLYIFQIRQDPYIYNQLI